MAGSSRDADIGELERRLQNARGQQRSPDALSLRFTAGPIADTSISKPGVILTVGRTKVSSVWIKDPAVSESHAQLKWTGAAWELVDVGSTNGTAVNGRPLAEEEPVVIRHGDEILFGEVSKCTAEVKLRAGANASVLDVLLAELGSGVDSLQARSEQGSASADAQWSALRQEVAELAGF